MGRRLLFTYGHQVSGEISQAEFKKIEDRAVNEAIDIQLKAGLEVITDGEMRRYTFFGHLIDAVEGYDKFGGWAIPFHDDEGHELVFKRPVVVSKLKRVRPLCEEEFVYLRAKTEHPAKVRLSAHNKPQRITMQRRPKVHMQTLTRISPIWWTS
jgi:5-methyltetrahydropteroyltriglutamate--homocysteine methyltransferase